jgi:hypothetical protein
MAERLIKILDYATRTHATHADPQAGTGRFLRAGCRHMAAGCTTCII